MSAGEITKLVEEMRAGDRTAKEELYKLIYPELQQLAKGMMVRQPDSHTLQPTALVNETAMRLLGNDDILRNVSGSASLFALIAQAMRHVLIDYARRRAASKRRSDFNGKPVALDEVVAYFERTEQLDLLALDNALEELKTFSQRKHDVVVSRFFGGLTTREIAAHLNVSQSTVEKDWHFARAWLRKELREE